MTACQKCWNDAYMRSLMEGRPQAEIYRKLLDKRRDNPCPATDEVRNLPTEDDRGTTEDDTPNNPATDPLLADAIADGSWQLAQNDTHEDPA